MRPIWQTGLVCSQKAQKEKNMQTLSSTQKSSAMKLLRAMGTDMDSKMFSYQDNCFYRRLLIILMVLLCLEVCGLAACDAGKKTSTYIGTWKLEKIMAEPGQDWLPVKYPFIMKLLPNGTLDLRLSAPTLSVHITGTWKILPDGRLQISQERQDGEAYEKPVLIVFSLENGKLISSARAYVNENERAQPGFIFTKEGK
jgi:hypothetical protein